MRRDETYGHGYHWKTRRSTTMNGLTMDYQLTVPALLRRAEALFGA